MSEAGGGIVSFMSLLDIWKNSKEHVLGLTIEQIVSNADDGRVLDGSDCSSELRQYFQETPSERIYDYVRHCLETSFRDSGLVLQDLVNEIARRLEFDVDHGLYRGSSDNVPFDGIWKSENSPDMPDILVEVKTTDRFPISLDKYAGYKSRLVDEGKISKDASILIVVGREDTGALEAQIRGSRYAWEMRLISVESLSKLLRIKEQSNEDSTVEKIKEILQPFEYTKIDRIIDVVFAAAEDVETDEIGGEDVETEEAEQDSPQVERKQIHTNRELLNEKREISINALGNNIEIALTRHRKTLFWSADRVTRVCSAVSKRYERGSGNYWYAYHPAWDNFLKGGQKSFLLLTCMDRSEAYAIPYSVVVENLPNLNKSARPDDKSYWHILLKQTENGDLIWNMSKTGKKLPLADYAVPLSK